MPGEIISATFDWFDAIQKGGATSAVLMAGALAWVVRDRARILVAYAADLKAKDDIIADKDAKLVSVSDRAITVMTVLSERLPPPRGPAA